MNQHRFRSSVLALCFLACAGLVLGCDWDKSTDSDQGLDSASLDAGAQHLGESMEVSDPESCRAACCNKPDCNLALVGYPADGGPQCQLVSCVVQDRDVCVLQPSTQFKVYRKTVKTERPHIVPLLGSLEPKTNETNNSKTTKPHSCC